MPTVQIGTAEEAEVTKMCKVLALTELTLKWERLARKKEMNIQSTFE